EALLAWVRKRFPDRHWERISIVEIEIEDDETPGSETDVEGFEHRFQEILDQVDRDWVNLSARSIHDGTLILALEWIPPDPRDPPSQAPPGYQKRVCVNWSGSL